MAPGEILIEIPWAAGASGGVLLTAWLEWHARAWPAAVTVDAGYATSHALARGPPAEAMSADATHVLFHLGLAGALAGTVEGRRCFYRHPEQRRD